MQRMSFAVYTPKLRPFATLIALTGALVACGDSPTAEVPTPELPQPEVSAETCANAVDTVRSDTMMGERVGGRMVLVGKGSPRSEAGFWPAGTDNVYIFGYRIADTLAQLLDLRIYGLHGVGSYPIADGYDPGTAFAAYGCGYGTGDPLTLHYVLSYWPLVTNMPGDSVWVTQWDSVSGRLRGTYSWHSTDTLGNLVPITDGTFDVIIQK